ncbi:MAG: nucleotide exchange factor GrpE [Selenomonadaceae bacterium]|nr:nucleotide exchange factor GrpE [Selenomonadaceae bacterium]
MEETTENNVQTPEEASPPEAPINENPQPNPAATAAAAAYAQAAKEAAEAVDVTVEDGEVETLKAELAETESSFKRLRADFENFRRRSAKEKEEIGAVSKEEMLKSMLPLIDNFERAMAADKDSDNFYQGISMIFNQFAEILKSQGLEQIQAKGQFFDPNFHQAVMRVQSDDLPEGMIAEVLQQGYQVNGKVIRPSMVQVVGE